MSKKLWGSRFSKKTDSLVEKFTKSINYDNRLALYDIIGSQIHVSILEKSKFIEPGEAKKLINALGKMYVQVKNGQFEPDENCEDIHTCIQNMLENDKEIGDLALKLHTARSRNDQVLFDTKLFCKSRLLAIRNLCAKLMISLLEVAKGNVGVIIPGFTHMQHAQLVFLSDYLQAYVEMLKRDCDRLESINRGIKLKLGAGAFAGTPIKPEFYNEAIEEFFKKNEDFVKATELRHDDTIPKSLDTVSDRDFVIETLSALAILGMHLSRLAEDLIIWSTKEFGYVELDDAFTTGSSLMPHKKNPDVLELIRGYTGTLYGNLVSVLTMMKGLPLTYNRDMQLDKPPLFSSFDILQEELEVLPKLVETLKWNKEAIRKRVEDEETFYATDLVYYLIGQGISFGKAHDIIGKLVKFSFDSNKKIKEMSDKELKQFSDKLDHTDIVKLMDPMVSVCSRISVDRSEKKIKEGA